MHISETTFTVSDGGNLTIPETVMREMRLAPGDTVRVAYLTGDGQQNSFREFLLSASPLDELSDEQQLRVPIRLLEQSNIPVDADLQIFCLDGCIFICLDSVLNTKELTAVLERLQTTEEVVGDLTGGSEQMLSQLKELIKHLQKGASTSEV